LGLAIWTAFQYRHIVKDPTDKRHKMKHSNLFAFLLIWIGLSTNLFSQSLNNFDDVLRAKKINKLFTKRVGKDIYQRTFLGTIRENDGSIKYYVVKEFLRIQAAFVFHGHSRILFFNKQKNLTKECRLSLPTELPFELKANTLYFKYSENGLTKTFAQDVATLRKMICVEPKNCYSVTNP